MYHLQQSFGGHKTDTKWVYIQSCNQVCILLIFKIEKLVLYHMKEL